MLYLVVEGLRSEDLLRRWWVGCMIRSLQKSKGSLGLGSIRHSSSAYFTRRPPIGLQSEIPSVDHIGHLLFAI
jgi:hypothetical protein